MITNSTYFCRLSFLFFFVFFSPFENLHSIYSKIKHALVKSKMERDRWISPFSFSYISGLLDPKVENKRDVSNVYNRISWPTRDTRSFKIISYIPSDRDVTVTKIAKPLRVDWGFSITCERWRRVKVSRFVHIFVNLRIDRTFFRKRNKSRRWFEKF